MINITQRRPNNASKISMDIDQLQKKLEEDLEQIDVLIEDRGTLKEKYKIEVLLKRSMKMLITILRR